MIDTEPVSVDAYVFDVLMADLVGHDRSRAAFLVYLYLWRRTKGDARRSVQVSYQTIAADTGLSRSTAQSAVAHLRRRGLVLAENPAPTEPVRYRVLRPWRR